MRSRAALLAAALALAACGGEADPEAPEPFAAAASGLTYAATLDGLEVRLALLPRVRLDGAWRGAGADGPCEAAGDEVRCPAGPGVAVAAADGPVVRARFEAAADAGVEALELAGTATLPGARGWISSGFQSWSQAGVLALAPPVPEAALEEALAARGDAEVLRTGEALSWGWTMVGGDGPALVLGAVSADRLGPWVQVARAGDGLAVRLGSGGAGERIAAAAGDTVEGEAWLVAAGLDEEALGRAFAARLPSRRAAAPAPAEAGWNSWYELWDDVDEAAVRANAPLARQVLAAPARAGQAPLLPAGAPPLRVVVDDGWQRAWGDWWPNEKFPSGLDGLAADLAADGFTVGAWLAPLLVGADTDLAAAHPDWLVEGAVYRHPLNGDMRVLDVTHPDAAAHLQETVQRLVGWGLGLLKIDFLFAGAWEGGRHEDVTGLQAYRRALALIRDAAGPDTVLLAVGAPATPSLPYVDAWRVGNDIAVEPFGPSWAFVPNQLRSIAARWPYCLAVLCDADPPILRDLPPHEVDAGAWTVALAGGALFLSDDLRALPADRLARGLPPDAARLALGGAPAVPQGLFAGPLPDALSSALADHLSGRGTHVVPALWHLPAGGRLALNATDAPLTVDGTEVPPHTAVRLD